MRTRILFIIAIVVLFSCGSNNLKDEIGTDDLNEYLKMQLKDTTYLVSCQYSNFG